MTIFWWTGHKRFQSELTEAVLAEELRTDASLIDSWRIYSADKRCSPAWYFEEKSQGLWVVGYHHDDWSKRIEETYTDGTIACANFILREIAA